MKPVASLAVLDAQHRYSINESIAYLRSSRASIYADINSGRLSTIRDGGRVYILGSELIRRSRTAYPSKRPAQAQAAI
jgi:hypothetical protein